MKTANELVDYIDHVLASLEADYSAIYDSTQLIRDKVPAEERNRLDWGLVHMHTNLAELKNDFKRHQETLMKDINAGKQIQDGIRGTDFSE